MDIVFPVMPFADAGRPSMGVSLLASEIKAAGFTVTTLYFNLDYASTIGLETYQRIASGYPPDMLVGEWIFSSDAFEVDTIDLPDYLADIFIPNTGADPKTIAGLCSARESTTAYLDQCAAEIMQHKPRIVGFSSVFHQTCACLSIARRLKDFDDAPIIVFGGANCEGEMGQQLMNSSPWIDFVCSGESDHSFPELVNSLLCGGTVEERNTISIPGVLQREHTNQNLESTSVADMDALPYPDFDGYFDRLSQSKLNDQFEGHLVFEMSRGCWWGAKHHCTFCGLNGATMAFRSKSAQRAFDEIEWLIERYGQRRLGCVDNILDMKYIKTLLPKIATAEFSVDLFFEVKANLRYEHLEELRAAGVTQIQPGIESFSDGVLKLMDKGCTGFQNIQMLRWCRELGIEVSWNILSGFPNEDPAEYSKMSKLLPKLTHLDPPCSCASVRLDRFSPFHERSSEYGFKRVRPARAYFYVFPYGRRELERLAYFFDYDYEDDRRPDEYIAPVQQESQLWIAAHAVQSGHDKETQNVPCLDAVFKNDEVIITDTRCIAQSKKHRFNGLAAEIYARCDSTTTIGALVREFNQNEETIHGILSDFDALNLIAQSNNRVLSLAVFRVRPKVPNIQASPTSCQLSDIPIYPVAS